MAKKPKTPPPRPVQAPKRRDDPRARQPIDRKIIWGGAATAVVIAAVIGIVIAVSGGGSSSKTVKPLDWSTIPNLQNGAPPWGPDYQELPDRLAALGLSQLSTEGTVIHIHQHLDLWVNGTKVTLPPNVGIDLTDQFITELHVHDGAPNIIHVESPVKKTFHLQQLFGEWGVRLTGSCVGSFCGKLHWWLNGKPQTGNPGLLALKDHQEIAIALGKPPAHVPSTFDFAKVGL